PSFLHLTPGVSLFPYSPLFRSSRLCRKCQRLLQQIANFFGHALILLPWAKTHPSLSVTTWNHPSVCTSTESTPGKSRTIGFQLSPASADAYTWPPLVPK